MQITCEAHGTVDWQGDVRCSACKQIYLCETHEDPETGKVKKRYPQAPANGMCRCGKRLFGGSDFTMRPVCRACAQRVITAN